MPPTPQDPMEIYVDDSKLTLHGLQQHYVKLAENEKNRKLNELLDALEFNQVVIFVKSVQRAIQLDKLLQECNFPSVAIHASMKQEDRIKLYQSFKDVRRLADRAARAARAAAARLRRRPLSFAHSSSIAFSSPRTSGGAASTSSALTSSSTMTCPTIRTRTCTASGAPGASAPRASLSRSPRPKRMRRSSRTCSLVSRCPSRPCRSRSMSRHTCARASPPPVAAAAPACTCPALGARPRLCAPSAPAARHAHSPWQDGLRLVSASNRPGFAPLARAKRRVGVAGWGGGGRHARFGT